MSQPQAPGKFRRFASVTFMWVMLAVTIVIATVVSQRRLAQYKIALGEERTIGRVSLRMPAKWNVGTSGASEINAVEVARARGGRHLVVEFHELSEFVSPSALVSSDVVPAQPEDLDQPLPTAFRPHETDIKISPITIAGQQGVLEQRRIVSGFVDSESEGGLKVVRASAVMPSRMAISLSLVGPAPVSPRDLDLVRQICASIRVRDEPATDMLTSSVDVGDGISLSRPHGFALIKDSDKLRVGCALLRNSDDWCAVEIIPTVFAGAVADEVEAQLAITDHRWIDAQIQELSPGKLRISPGDSADGTVAYAAVAPNRQGVIVLIHPGGNKDNDAAKIWDQLVAGFKTQDALDLSSLESSGAQAVKQLNERGLEPLLQIRRQEQWWQWSRDFPEHFIGWVHRSFEQSSPCTLVSVCRGRLTQRSMIDVDQKWESNAVRFDQVMYTARNLVTSGSADGRPRPVLTQQLLQRNGNLAMQFRPSDRAAGNATIPTPANFVSGGWLSLLMDQLPNQPVVLSTESWVNFGASAMLRPMKLLVEPIVSGSNSASTTAPAGRVFSVRVLGTQERQHWYLKPDGSLDHVDITGFQHLEPSTREQIKFNIGDDSRLEP